MRASRAPVSSTYRHRARIEAIRQTGIDLGGEPIRGFVEVERGAVWCKIEPISAGERRLASQVGHETTHRITMRYRPDVDETCRIVFRGRSFNIDGIRNIDEADQVLELTAVEVAE